MARRKLKPIKSVEEIPEHMSEEEAAEFYGTHSLARVWDQLEPVEEEFAFGPLAPMKRVSLRLREDFIERLKRTAQAKGIPLRTLVWLWLKVRLEQEEAKGKPE